MLITGVRAYHILIAFYLFAGLLLFVISQNIFAAESVVISEIMFNPNGDENAREYVEIQNLSLKDISLEGFIIGDGAGFDKIIPAENGSWNISSGAHAVILDPDYFSCGDYYDIPPGTQLFTVPDKAIGDRGLSNSTAEPIYIVSANGDTLSKITYSIECPPGFSWERIIPGGSDDFSNFRASENAEGTPGRNNSVTPGDFNPSLTTESITFNTGELQAGRNLEIAVKWINSGLSVASAIKVNLEIEPGICTTSVSFDDAVDPGETSAIKKAEIGPLSGGRLTLRAFINSEFQQNTLDDTLTFSLDVPIPENSIILNEVMAAPSTGNPEWAELFNTQTFPVNLRGWGIADNSGETSSKVIKDISIGPYGFLLISKTLIPNISEGIPYVLTETFPSLNNDADSVVLIDFTGVEVDSMKYENAETGKSFELISPKMRGKKNAWDLSVSDGGSTPGNINSINYSTVPSEGKTPDDVKLEVSPNPFLGDTVISYRLPFPLARVKLFVFDRRGRHIATLREEEESGSEWKGTWNGISDGSRLSAGPYILYLEALDKKTGRVCTVKKPVVIASRL